MPVASAPGKVILLGEHGVVYGHSCLSIAIDMRVGVEVEEGKEFTVNGIKMDSRKHTYIKHAIEKLWNGAPLTITTFSKIPSASGLGSSAAITVATVACITKIKNAFTLPNIAQKSFEIEHEVQRGGSPNDTSACTHGSAIFLSKEKKEGFVWSITHQKKKWFVHPVDISDVKLVIGMTGIKSKTDKQVEKVRKFVKYSSFARELTEEMGFLVPEGTHALINRDFVRLGEIMNKGQKILHTLGASSPKLEKLISSALKAGAYGAKLTGAGGGGSMIALTDEHEKIALAIEKVGGKALIVSTSNEGVKVWG
jgi:mevalonate kinase